MVKQTAAGGAAADGVLVTEASEICSARMRRIADADDLRRRCTQVLRPLYECIGHGVARRDWHSWILGLGNLVQAPQALRHDDDTTTTMPHVKRDTPTIHQPTPHFPRLYL